MASRVKGKDSLGTINFVMKNKDLLGKLLWRFPLERDYLCAIAITGGMLNKECSSRCRCKDMSQDHDSFSSCHQFVVANREWARFRVTFFVYRLSSFHNVSHCSILTQIFSSFQLGFWFTNKFKRT